MKLNNEEMLIVKGGAFKTASIVSGIFVFFIGIIDGIFRPKRCN